MPSPCLVPAGSAPHAGSQGARSSSRMAPSFPAHVHHPAGARLPPAAGQGLCCRGPGAAVFLLGTEGVKGLGGSCRAQHRHLSTPRAIGAPHKLPAPFGSGGASPKSLSPSQMLPTPPSDHLPASVAGDPPARQPTWALQRPCAAAPGNNAPSKPICSQQFPPKCADPLREALYLAVSTRCQGPPPKAHVPSTPGHGELPGCYPGGSG